MKHLVQLTLGILFFATGQILGSFPITNKTPYWAYVGVHYSVCRDDNTVIAPGDTVQIYSGGCTVQEIEGVLVRAPGDPSKNITFEKWKRHKGAMDPVKVEIISSKNGYILGFSWPTW
jgi:hypothetical protein